MLLLASAGLFTSFKIHKSCQKGSQSNADALRGHLPELLLEQVTSGDPEGSQVGWLLLGGGCRMSLNASSASALRPASPATLVPP